MRIRYLDSLRGLAALCVVIYHYTGAFGDLPWLPRWFMRTPLAFFVDGIAAVTLFFVLSGFVLTYKAFHGSEKYSIKSSLVPFLINRVFRIMPPFMAWVVLSALCQKYLLHHVPVLTGVSSWFSTIWVGPVALGRILREFFILSNIEGGHFIPQDWSLTYEMNISLFIPLYTLLAMAGNIPFYFYLCLRMSKNIFLFPFFLGIFVSKNLKTLSKKIAEFSLIGSFILFSVGLSLYAVREIVGPGITVWLPKYFDQVIFIVNSIGAAILIAQACAGGLLQKILSHSWLVWLGKVSYSLYLLHVVVLKIISPFILLTLQKLSLGDSLLHWVGLLVTCAVALVISEISYIMIEQPSISGGRYLTNQWRRLGFDS